MRALVGVVEKPGERLEKDEVRSKNKPKAYIVTVEVIRSAVKETLMVGVVIAVMTDEEEKMPPYFLAERKVPVKLRSVMAVVMGYQLGQKAGGGREVKEILETEVPAVLAAA